MNNTFRYLLLALLAAIVMLLAFMAFSGGDDEPTEVIIKDNRSIYCQLYGACDNG